MKILAIDDEAVIRTLIEAILINEGYDVVLGEDGEIGVARAKSEKPDLIITDMSMPKMTGFELIRTLKNDAETKDIPIIALTATAQTQDDRIEAYEGGVDAFDTKPIDARRLIDKIRDTMSKRIGG